MVGQHCDEQVCTDKVVRAMPERAQAEFGFQLSEGVFEVTG